MNESIDGTIQPGVVFICSYANYDEYNIDNVYMIKEPFHRPRLWERYKKAKRLKRPQSEERFIAWLVEVGVLEPVTWEENFL